METLNVELSAEMMALIPVVAAILQMLKKVPLVKKVKEWLPLASILISFGLLYYCGVQQPIVESVVIGLTASGGYDLLKGRQPKTNQEIKS